MSNLRITILTAVSPLPANHGGSLDIWNRILALRAANVAVQLVLLGDKVLSDSDLSTLRKEGVSLLSSQPKRGFLYWVRTATLLSVMPLFAARREFHGQAQRDLFRQIVAFRPDAIMLESIDLFRLGQRIRKSTGLPLFLRSHNIEHTYKKSQIVGTKGLSRYRTWLDLRRICKFEYAALKQCQVVFDISVDDMEYWKQKGLSNIVYLPPVFFFSDTIRPSARPDSTSVSLEISTIQIT